MGSSTNSLTVSETMLPDGVTSAHIYRKSLKKLPLDALPDEIDWVKTIDGDSIITKNNVDFVKSNSVLELNKFMPIIHHQILIAQLETQCYIYSLLIILYLHL